MYCGVMVSSVNCTGFVRLRAVQRGSVIEWIMHWMFSNFDMLIRLFGLDRFFEPAVDAFSEDFFFGDSFLMMEVLLKKFLSFFKVVY